MQTFIYIGDTHKRHKKAKDTKEEVFLCKIKKILPKLFRQYYCITETYKPTSIPKIKFIQAYEEAINYIFKSKRNYQNTEKLKEHKKVSLIVSPLYENGNIVFAYDDFFICTAKKLTEKERKTYAKKIEKSSLIVRTLKKS